MPRRIYEITFIASALILVALVGVLNCLQGTPFISGMKCAYGYTSGDLIVKAIATAIFLLLLGLLLGPVAAVIAHPSVTKERKRAAS
jgi:hypothetical protein